MGSSNSKIDEDEALQLCRERKRFVRQALDGRCSLAAAHVTYIHSLRNVGTALRKFTEPAETPIESSLYTSTSATPDPLASTEKSFSHFSSSSPSLSQPEDGVETLSPPPSTLYQVYQMKFMGSSSKKVEEKPSIPIIGTITSSSTPQNATNGSEETSPVEAPPQPPGTPPWDYFGLFHPIDQQFAFQEEKGTNQELDNANGMRRVREEEGIPELEDEEEKSSSLKEDESEDSEDEFDGSSAETLVRSFENLNRVHDHGMASSSPTMPSARRVDSETELLSAEKGNSPDLAPLKATPSVVVVELETMAKRTPAKESHVENKVASKDLFSSLKEIEHLFIKASESGRELPRMLEANKLHFRPIYPGKQGGSVSSRFLGACFSCGEEKSQLQEEAAQTGDVKYLTWHRTTSSRSSSSRNLLGMNTKDDNGDLTSNLFDNFCMNSGSHASTLDRLYAWERKLSDEVKASQIVRKEYDSKCKILRHLESDGESSHKIDKIRAIVKDLHSRITVAIHRINSISNRIEELRDGELQPQLEELIQGLRRMWEVMSECHTLQYGIITAAHYNGNAKITPQSESHRLSTIHLENELSFLCSSFTKWVTAQKSYLMAINGWLFKCVSIKNKSTKRKRRNPGPPLRNYGPPIYTTCDVWLDRLEKLPAKEVAESIKGLGAETSLLISGQEKKHGKSRKHPYPMSWKADRGSESRAELLRGEASEEDDVVSGLDGFRTGLVRFISQLSDFSGSCTKMYEELENDIRGAKSKYDQLKSQS